jgi:serine/threonine protein kinase
MAVNENNSDILMDYIPFPTLKEFLLFGQHSISLQTKLLLMVSLLQGVCSLARCDVVHLDLKPNNIMLGPDLLIKLLDFGESYHPAVKNKPGHTVPYSSPEVHASADHYTIKSDLYSFGIILFEILYGRHPFALHLEQNMEKYRTGGYLGHWLYAPEQADLLGECSVYKCLNHLVSKCLEVEPYQRPEEMAVGLLLL